MKSINPYLAFNGKCREAMSFYKDVLGGELSFMSVGESPMAGQIPGGDDTIMHSSLMFDGGVIMGTDMNGPGCAARESFPSIAIDCSSEEEINRIFSKLEVGGNTMCPVGPAFWGGLFGSTTDKYGTNWMLTFNEETCV